MCGRKVSGSGDRGCWRRCVRSRTPEPRGVRHPLAAILALSVCAMLSGARSLYAIAQWGREHSQLAQ